MRIATGCLIAAMAITWGRPAMADDGYTAGLQAFAQEQYEDAIRHFQGALDRRPGYAAYAYHLAMSYLRNGQKENAVETFFQVVDADSADQELREKAWVNLLRAKVDLTLYSEVEKDGSRAAAALPGSAEILNQIGRARLNNNDFSGAVDMFVKATRLDTSSWTIYNNLGLAYLKHSNLKGAMHAFERAAELNGRLPFIFNNLGVTYERLQEYDKAIVAFEKALALDPNYKKARMSAKRVRKLRARETGGKSYVIE